MKIPLSIPHFKLAAAIVSLYAVIWLALEGDVTRDILLASSLLALGIVYITTHRLGGRTLSAGRFIGWATGSGVALGCGLALLTLFLMALKTGLHAHGPEYTPQEVAWVWRQLPLWAGVGTLAGLGLGLLAAASRMAADADG